MTAATYLCFDYGEKRIGTAVGQTLTATASPLEIITVKNGKPDWQKISGLIHDWQPLGLVVGLPLEMDGSRQEITELAEKFCHQLKGRFKLPVHNAEERLSTYEAKKRTKDMKELDNAAAQVILESWLSHQSTQCAP